MAQNDPNQTTATQDINLIDREASKSVAPLYASRVFVQDIGAGLLRVSVGEMLNEEIRYHAAFVVTAGTAMELAAIMARLAYPILNPQPQTGAENPFVAPASSNGG
jgi:hypothetical protein